MRIRNTALDTNHISDFISMTSQNVKISNNFFDVNSILMNTNFGLEGEDGKTDHDGGSEEKGLIHQNIALQCPV